MKKAILITALFVSVLLLSGCDEPTECSMGIDCRFFECPLNCVNEKYCSEGKCECKCTGQTAECENATDCANNCGIPPNETVCTGEKCGCKFECNHAVDCDSFECLLECQPNYNYCENEACTCACEQGSQNYSLWQINELKEELKGKIIVVKGTADYSGTHICTTQECPEESPCCNKCSSELGLIEIGEDNVYSAIKLGGVFEGSGVICSGNDCELNCHPLEIGDKYEIQGLWKEESGIYFLEPLKVTLLEKSIAKISSDKTEYAQGETIKFSIEYGKEISRHSWDKPKIQRKEGDQWITFDSSCECTVNCMYQEERCEDNLVDCDIVDTCDKIEKGSAFSWNQEYCELEQIDCNWSTEGITEPLYCSKIKAAELGTYKLVFYYVKVCGGEKTTIYSNEFSVN